MEKIYVILVCQTWTLAYLSETVDHGIRLQAWFLFPCCQGAHVYLIELICGKEKKMVNKHKMQQKKMPN